MSRVDPELERAAWQTLVESEGWRLLAQYCGTLWSDQATLQRLAQVVGTVKPGDEAGQQDSILAVLAARNAVNEIMRYPTMRIEKLDKPERPMRVGRA